MRIQKNIKSKNFFRFFLLLFTLFMCTNLFGQCDSSFFSITTTSNQQEIGGITISLSSPTDAQSTRSAYESVTGYLIGNENKSEEINFSLSQPVTRIKIIARALSAVRNNIEYFTLSINGEHYIIQPAELITPDFGSGTKCFLQPNGSVEGDNLINGDGSFIFTLESSQSITNFQIKDSVTSLNPEGGIFDVQVYAKCKNDTTENSGLDSIKFYIPTAFTPNNDGKNDFFGPIISGNLERFEFRIFNRWGQNIFSALNYGKGWDGTIRGIPQQTGVFAWICYYQGIGQHLQIKKGTAVLIR